MKLESLIALVKRKMEEKNLKKNELAEKLGVSPSYITRLFSGSASFEINHLIIIAEIFNMSLSNLILEAEETIPDKIQINKAMEEVILTSDLSFEIWFYLDKKCSIDEIAENYDKQTKNEIVHCLEMFLQHGVCFSDGYYYWRRNLAGPLFYFSESPLYLERRMNLMKKIIQNKPDFSAYLPRFKNEWLETQTDVFIAGYYTDEQLIHKRELIKKVMSYVLMLDKININKKQNHEKMKLHILNVTDMAFPYEKKDMV